MSWDRSNFSLVIHGLQFANRCKINREVTAVKVGKGGMIVGQKMGSAISVLAGMREKRHVFSRR